MADENKPGITGTDDAANRRSDDGGIGGSGGKRTRRNGGSGNGGSGNGTRTISDRGSADARTADAGTPVVIEANLPSATLSVEEDKPRKKRQYTKRNPAAKKTAKAGKRDYVSLSKNLDRMLARLGVPAGTWVLSKDEADDIATVMEQVSDNPAAQKIGSMLQPITSLIIVGSILLPRVAVTVETLKKVGAERAARNEQTNTTNTSTGTKTGTSGTTSGDTPPWANGVATEPKLVATIPSE